MILTSLQERELKHEGSQRTDGLIKKLKKSGELNQFQKEIQKKIDTGTLVELSESKLKEVLNGTHHFSYLSMVKNET